VPARPAAETKAALEQQEAELRYANRVINQLALPWDRLFTEVEASVGERVILLSIEPDMSSNTLQITAEAEDLDAMLVYAKRLRASKVFKDAHLKSHQLQIDVPGKPVRFVVNAKWIVSLSQKGTMATKKY
jgi:Tfp pilus assembly protein PilN